MHAVRRRISRCVTAVRSGSAAVLLLPLLLAGGTAQQPCAALVFDATSDFVRVPPHASLDAFGDFTLEAWVKPMGVTTFLTIIGKANSTAPRSYHLGTDQIDANGWRPRIYLNHLHPPNSPFSMYAPAVIPFGAWHHIAATRLGATVKLYVDGTAVNSASYNVPLGSNPTVPVVIGGDMVGAAANGLIDDVRIWNIGRTDAQIVSSMNGELTGLEPGLVGYWRFNDSWGQVAANSALATGAAADGTLGATTAVGPDDPGWTNVGLPLPCPTPAGACNTPCASLIVNGTGAGGCGPFSVAAPAGSILSFDWIGPVNQQLALFSSPTMLVGQILGPVVVDLSLGGLVVVFNPYDPVLGPFFRTGVSGTSLQSLAVPSGMSGMVLNVQGVVFDTAPACPGGPGFATTASFSIQF